MAKYNNIVHTVLAGTALASLFLSFKNTFVELPQKAIEVGKVKFLSIPAKLTLGLGLVIPVLSLLLAIFLFQVIPLPHASEPLQSSEFSTLDKSIDGSFSATANGLNRIDLLFKNPGLENKDEYVLRVFDEENDIIHEQTFKGNNIGDPSTLRFDLPLQPHSKGKIFTTRVTIENPVSPYLSIAVQNSTQTLAVRSFYRQSFSFSNSLNDTMSQTAWLLRELWGWFILTTFIFLVAVCRVPNRLLHLKGHKN